MAPRDFYWMLLAAVGIGIWQYPKFRELSSYSKKFAVWYFLYIVTILGCFPWGFGFYGDCREGLDDDEIFCIFIFLFLIPCWLYLLLPTWLKHIGHWGIIRWIDKKIDNIYQNLAQQQKKKEKEE